MSDVNWISPAGFERLRQEFYQLQAVERPRIVEEVSYAASLGDRSENAEYIYGKRRLREIDSRLAFLTRRLDAAKVIDATNSKATDVQFGATVETEEASGQRRTWHILGEDEVNVSQGIISWRSPLGAALLGRETNERIEYETPAGERALTVRSIRYPSRSPGESEG